MQLTFQKSKSMIVCHGNVEPRLLNGTVWKVFKVTKKSVISSSNFKNSC